MYNKTNPKKIFRITDLTFVLEDDFSGDVRDALNELAKYMTTKSELNEAQSNSTSTIEAIFNNKKKKNNRLCMNYGIFEADDDGNYVLQ